MFYKQVVELRMSSIKLLVTNQKGGVGKSTIAANLAAYLAIQEDSSVTLIDFDKQSSSTKWVQKAPDVGIKIINPAVNFQQTGPLVLAELKRHLKQHSDSASTSVTDLTWTGGIPWEFMLEFDVLIVPSAITKFEMASSEIFILEYINNHLQQIRRKQQTILITPSRVDKNFNPEQKFLNFSNIQDCAVTPPIHFIPAIDNFVYEDFLCVSSDPDISQNFSTFGQYIAHLIHEKIIQKQENLNNVRNPSSNGSLTVLEQFKQDRAQEKTPPVTTFNKWIPNFLIKK